MKKTVLTIVVIIVLLTISFLTFRPKAPLPATITINTADQPTLGKQAAPIHFVAYEDLKCRNCAIYTNQIFPKIKQRFIDTGMAKYTVINLAFINGSMPAANAARCLYKQKPEFFFDFIHLIYANQPPEEKDWATVPYLLQTANKIDGVNQNQLSDCIMQSPYSNFINDNLLQAMQLMDGKVATPTLFINGIVVKPLNLQRIEEIVDTLKH